MLVFLIILPLIFLLFSFLYFKLENRIDNIKLNYHCERNRELKNKVINLSLIILISLICYLIIGIIFSNVYNVFPGINFIEILFLIIMMIFTIIFLFKQNKWEDQFEEKYNIKFDFFEKRGLFFYLIPATLYLFFTVLKDVFIYFFFTSEFNLLLFVSYIFYLLLAIIIYFLIYYKMRKK